MHLISAWASKQNLVLGQIKSNSKKNEIKDLPKLLDLLVLKGAIVTYDAMGCQKSVALKIREKEADYVLALKSNHKDLFEDVKLFFENKENMISHKTTEKNHGRIETRKYFMSES